MVKKLAQMRWKTSFFSALWFLVVYLQAKGHIGNDEAVLIAGIVTAFGGTANYISNRK